MPKTKNGGFKLDDSSCDPYGVVKMREEMQKEKKGKKKTSSAKGGVGKKK